MNTTLRSVRPSTRAALVAAIAFAPCAAQDPSVPSGGFPIVELLDLPISYADGYQSRLDIRLPSPVLAPAPVTGWPVVLVAHGLAIGHNRKGEAGNCVDLARAGYIAVCHDVRGQGDAMVLNSTGGTDFNGELDKGDLVEVLHFARNQLGPALDWQRLAMYGWSQGGWLAWGAAAYSGRQLPAPRGVHTHFPQLRCVATGGMVADNLDLYLPQGSACFHWQTAGGGFAPYPIIEPGLQALLAGAWLQQDPNVLAAVVFADPWRQEKALLTSCTVPLFGDFAWDDENVAMNGAIAGFALLPASTPRFVFLHDSGHGGPMNELSIDTARDLRLRWFDRFLKNAPDELPLQSPFLVSGVPADLTAHFDPRTVLATRQLDAISAPGPNPTVLWLREQDRLLPAPPTTAEMPDQVVHQVAPGFDPLAYLQAFGTGGPAAVRAAVPHDAVVHVGDPLPVARDLVGSPRATVWIDSTAPDLQVSIALFDQDASGGRRYVAGGFRAERGRTPGISMYAVDLNPTSYVFHAGHRIVLAVENLPWHRPPGIDVLRTAPFLSSYTFASLHTNVMPARVELPLLEPALSARATRATMLSWPAGVVPLELDGGVARGGHLYLTLMTVSGTVPGTPVFGAHVPINGDGITWLGLSASAPYFVGFIGALDTAGRGGSSVLLPAGVLNPLVGAQMSFAAVTIGPAGEFAASAASQVSVRP